MYRLSNWINNLPDWGYFPTGLVVGFLFVGLTLSPILIAYTWLLAAPFLALSNWLIMHTAEGIIVLAGVVVSVAIIAAGRRNNITKIRYAQGYNIRKK